MTLGFRDLADYIITKVQNSYDFMNLNMISYNFYGSKSHFKPYTLLSYKTVLNIFGIIVPLHNIYWYWGNKTMQPFDLKWLPSHLERDTCDLTK